MRFDEMLASPSAYRVGDERGASLIAKIVQYLGCVQTRDPRRLVIVQNAHSSMRHDIKLPINGQV